MGEERRKKRVQKGYKKGIKRVKTISVREVDVRHLVSVVIINTITNFVRMSLRKSLPFTCNHLRDNITTNCTNQQSGSAWVWIHAGAFNLSELFAVWLLRHVHEMSLQKLTWLQLTLKVWFKCNKLLRVITFIFQMLVTLFLQRLMECHAFRIAVVVCFVWSLKLCRVPNPNVFMSCTGIVFTLFLPFLYPVCTLFLPFFYPVCTPRFPHSIQSRMFHNIMV